jgi:hypothetical protein
MSAHCQRSQGTARLPLAGGTPALQDDRCIPVSWLPFRLAHSSVTSRD